MAAGGWKIFTAGDVLTADDTMDYLQQGVLVFDSSGARGSAIASPVEGQFSYLKDTDSTEYYDGAAWTQVAQGGLVHIVTESFSAVSSVSLDNCFSGDYDNYRIVISQTGTGVNQFLRLRASGTDTTSGYSARRSDLGASYATAAYTTEIAIGVAQTNRTIHVYDIASPFVASTTGLVGHASYGNDGIFSTAAQTASTQFDGFTIYVASGNFTGTVSVYGYKK